MIVEVEVAIQPAHCICQCLIVSDIHLPLLHTTPQSPHEYVVQRSPSPVHTNPDVVSEQTSGEVLAGKLPAPVCVEHLWPFTSSCQR